MVAGACTITTTRLSFVVAADAPVLFQLGRSEAHSCNCQLQRTRPYVAAQRRGGERSRMIRIREPTDRLRKLARVFLPPPVLPYVISALYYYFPAFRRNPDLELCSWKRLPPSPSV